MTASSLVSVIIPLYNHEDFIEQCLNSILADTYPSKEIVIIDDGSRDSSAETVRRWQAGNDLSSLRNFRFITRSNKGLTKTLNELVALAEGEYIAVLASDDFLLEGGIAARVAYLEAHPDKLAVFADCALVDYQGTLLSLDGISDLHGARKPLLLDERTLPYEVVFNWCVPGPVFMARSVLYEKIGGYDETIAVEDWDFYLRIAAGDLLGFIDVRVAGYRLRPDDVIKKTSIEQLIRFNSAMLKTADVHRHAFGGLRSAYLFAESLKYKGVLERLQGSRTLLTFIRRKTGRVLVAVIKGLYNLWVMYLIPGRRAVGKE